MVAWRCCRSTISVHFLEEIIFLSASDFTRLLTYLLNFPFHNGPRYKYDEKGEKNYKLNSPEHLPCNAASRVAKSSPLRVHLALRCWMGRTCHLFLPQAYSGLNRLHAVSGYICKLGHHSQINIKIELFALNPRFLNLHMPRKLQYHYKTVVQLYFHLEKWLTIRNCDQWSILLLSLEAHLQRKAAQATYAYLELL